MSNDVIDPNIQPNQLTQEQIQQLMQAGISMDKIKLLQTRMKSRAKTPIGGMVGDRYVSNPLAILENAVNQYKDERSNTALQGEQDTALASIPAARSLYAQALMADVLRKKQSVDPMPEDNYL